MNKAALRAFRTVLDGFLRKQITVAKRSTGSMLSLDMSLDPNADCIWLQCCGWYALDARKIVCASSMDAKRMDAFAQELISLRIQEIDFMPDTLMLTVVFSNGVRLCAHPIEARGYEHWSLRADNAWWTLGPGTRLGRER